MDSRAALMVGGGTAIVASVAVATVFAVTGAVALADRPGAALARSTVVVAGEPQPAGGSDSLAGAPVTVPAPAPLVIAPSTPRAPEAPEAPAVVPGPVAGQTPVGPGPAERRSGGQDSQRAGGSGAQQDRNAQGQQGSRAGSPGDQGQNAQQRLDQDAAKWRDRITEQVRRLGEQIQDSALRAARTSEQGSPRTPLGSQKKQSPRSPDNGG